MHERGQTLGSKLERCAIQVGGNRLIDRERGTLVEFLAHVVRLHPEIAAAGAKHGLAVFGEQVGDPGTGRKSVGSH